MEPPSSAAQGILNTGTVTEAVGSSSKLSLTEYFSPPSNTKDYDGVCMYVCLSVSSGISSLQVLVMRLISRVVCSP